MQLEVFGEDRPAFCIELEHFARAIERRRKLLPLLGIGRKPRNKRFDLFEERIAARIEGSPVEGRITIKALEAIAGENGPERRRNRNPALCVEGHCVMGDEPVHGRPPPRSKCRDQRSQQGDRSASTARDRMGVYGLTWA